MSSVFEIEVNGIDGQAYTLDKYRGQVVLVVDTASKCGFTPQYTGLQELYDHFKDRGFVVLGFPCNQFGAQEPGSEAEIQSFCSLNHGVSFPLHAKVDVNGDEAHPLFRHLKKAAPGLMGSESIKWNFTKFLIDKNGTVKKRYGSKDAPSSIADDIEALLSA